MEPEICDLEDEAEDERPPPLPTRPRLLEALQGDTEGRGLPSRPKLISLPTTAISSTQVQTQAALEQGNGGIESQDRYASSLHPTGGSGAQASIADIKNKLDGGNQVIPEESNHILLDTTSDLDTLSILEGSVASNRTGFFSHAHDSRLTRIIDGAATSLENDAHAFSSEFDDLVNTGNSNGESLSLWRSKRKHFLILSQAGKPVWQRHGSDQLVSGYVGAIQTVISFFESSGDSLRTFTAGDTRFVVTCHGPLYLAAISRLGESEQQLRSQLEALYMQILSTLTYPNLLQIFSLQPSTNLRKPLQGTESLLSSLADSFTRGSPSTLLSSLECLRLKNRQRQTINDVLLKKRCPELLYGLVVAGGRLVSVVRPKTHSLHPSDLKLIFNMLFEANGIQAGGGESWIPMCLPGFNKNGYLYMYVSYLDDQADLRQHKREEGNDAGREDIAILLLSSKKDAFFELQACRNNIVSALESSGLLDIIRRNSSVARPSVDHVVPGGGLLHFLYKSRGNLQFVMPSWGRIGHAQSAKRYFMCVYESLHANLHAKGSQLKVHYSTTEVSVNLAWLTDVFELYCIAEPDIPKHVLAQSANKVVQWIRKEEERLFIIGGAVF